MLSEWTGMLSEPSDVNSVFSSFYKKFNKLVNKHAPMKTISNHKPQNSSPNHGSLKVCENR